ncbi:MAG: BBP7 family outer membrane beta-barrel protein [Pirellulaceae bacterium]|nr:BBP7 family outer membrane beta-barrel protein [Pirellulaceae bacterium]MDP7017022.1 BBP7 family outer membrane beta-barrel protein [Pirellulaceae bacterium]
MLRFNSILPSAAIAFAGFVSSASAQYAYPLPPTRTPGYATAPAYQPTAQPTAPTYAPAAGNPYRRAIPAPQPSYATPYAARPAPGSVATYPAPYAAPYFPNPPMPTAAPPANLSPPAPHAPAPHAPVPHAPVPHAPVAPPHGHSHPHPHAHQPAPAASYFQHGATGWDYDSELAKGITGEYCAPTPPARSPWYASAGALLMTRDWENEVWFSYDDNYLGSMILGSRDAGMGWEHGADIRIGRYLNCGSSSIEGVYWGLNGALEEANAYGADMVGNLDTSLAFDSLTYDDGGGPAAVVDWFNGAERHRLRRSFHFHNIELNHWHHHVIFGESCATDCGKSDCSSCGSTQSCRTTPAAPRMRLSWMAGVRYFKFKEGFEYASDETNTVFGDGPDNELYYIVDVDNHLLGLQLGGMAEWCVTSRLQMSGLVKVGVFGNRIEHVSFVGGYYGAAYVDNAASPYDGEYYDVNSSTTDVSLLAEIDLGLRYQINECWNVGAGYRALGLTGVALSTNQVPYYFADLRGVEHIDSNGSLILHGTTYFRAEYNY